MSTAHTYRPDIDGLRAIAVLAVILFHARATWLPSGFLGVDIFFVISGFLITGIISREMQNGTFSLKNFYLRRAKRILPAFLTVLLCTLTASIYLMDDLIGTLKSARYALLFAANIYFGREVGYFDDAAAEKPLQHIWSLSVEEQFYFIFPLLLLWLYRCWQGLPLKKIHILFTLLTIASIASFYIDYRRYDPYFLPWTRAYELLLGAWFALIGQQNPAALKPPHPATAASRILPYTAGLAILIILVLPPNVWPESQTLPRLIICLATAYLLATGHLKPTFIQRGLSWHWLVMIGLWSYSLYLWHWPIFALLRYIAMSAHLPTATLLLAIGACFVLAYLSYRWIEQPVRKMQPTRRQLIGAACCYIGLIVAVVFMTKIERATNDAPFQNLASSHYHNNPCGTSCHRGLPDTQATVLAIGDSHTYHYYPFYDILGKHEGWAMQMEWDNACPVVQTDPEIDPHRTQLNSRCRQLRSQVLEMAKNYQHIVWAQRWSAHTIAGEKPADIPGHFTSDPNFLSHFEHTLQALISQGKQVYVLSDNPNIGLYYYRAAHLRSRGINVADPEAGISATLTEQANRQIQAIVARYPQAHWVEIDFTRYLPADYRHQGLPIYSDDDHFNAHGASYLAERFIQDGQKLIQTTH